MANDNGAPLFNGVMYRRGKQGEGAAKENSLLLVNSTLFWKTARPDNCGDIIASKRKNISLQK